VLRAFAEQRLVDGIFEAMRRLGMDPFANIEAAVATVRGWSRTQWLVAAMGTGLRPADEASRDAIVEALRRKARASDSRFVRCVP
jgi:hypothetical protein